MASSHPAGCVGQPHYVHGYHHHGHPHCGQPGPHYVHQPVRAAAVSRVRYPYGTVYGQPFYGQRYNGCTGTLCLFGTSLGFGIFLIVIGFILLMVGYFAKPFFDKGSTFYEDEVQRLKNCRTAGWVLLSIGILLLILGIFGIKKNRRSRSVTNTQVVTTAATGQQQVAVHHHNQQQQFPIQPTAPPAMGYSTAQASSYHPEFPCAPEDMQKDCMDMSAPPSYDEAVGQ